jgi:DNA processing protein
VTGEPLPVSVAAGQASGSGVRRRLDDALARWRVRLPQAAPERDVATVERLGGRLLVPGDAEWPERLADLGPACPPCLWARGPSELATALEPSVALVGARASTAYGDHVAGDLAAGVAARGLAVVSGGAFGIDAAAHRGALAAGGTTIAVLACGVDRAYPRAHEQLLARIAETGLVVTETAPGGAPTRWRFLERNRLIAALSGATVVVEAAWRSGALSTAGKAAAIGRPLGAVPGPVMSATSAGCHRLLRELDAQCVTDSDEVVELVEGIGSSGAGSPRDVPAQPHDGLDAVDLRVLDALPLRSPRPVSSVAVVAGLPEAQVLGALGRLALLQLAQSAPGADGQPGWRRRGGQRPSRSGPAR